MIFCLARSQRSSLRALVPKDLPCRYPPLAWQAQPRSSSASRRSAAAKPTRSCVGDRCLGRFGSGGPLFLALRAFDQQRSVSGCFKAVFEGTGWVCDGRRRRALLLESYEAAMGAEPTCLPLSRAAERRAIHRTRSSPDGSPIIRCMRKALADADMAAEQIDHINAQETARRKTTGWRFLATSADIWQIDPIPRTNP
jgi:Beta-ketoacyl synthase, C-terminal domain